MSDDYIHPLSINGQLMKKDARIADLEAALDDMHKGHDAICKYVSELEAALKMAADDLDAAAEFTKFNVYHVAANQARAALKGEK